MASAFSKPQNRRHFSILPLPLLCWLMLSLLTLAAPCMAQVCQTAPDMPAPTRTALESAAKRYFDMSARGDVASLKQNSISSLAANFTGIEAAVKENQTNFTGAQATVEPPFLLTADGPQALARAEFLCGVFGKPGQTKIGSASCRD